MIIFSSLESPFFLLKGLLGSDNLGISSDTSTGCVWGTRQTWQIQQQWITPALMNQVHLFTVNVSLGIL